MAISAKKTARRAMATTPYLNTSTKMHSNVYNVHRKTIKSNKLTAMRQRKWLSVLRKPLSEPWQQPQI